MLHNKPTELQGTAYVVLRVASTYHIVLLHKAADDIGTHQIKQAHCFYFTLFVSSGLGMCDRLNSLVCNDRSNSQWRLQHSGAIVKELNTVRLT